MKKDNEILVVDLVEDYYKSKLNMINLLTHYYLGDEDLSSMTGSELFNLCYINGLPVQLKKYK